MRTFLAIDVPSDLHGPLSRELDSLKETLSDIPLRWVPLENIHITVKFLGETSPDLLPELTRTIRRCCKGAGRFELSVGALGAFPALRRPRVVWIGASAPQGKVAELHDCLDSDLASLGFERDQRALHLHLTAARVRKSISAQDSRLLGARLQARSVPALGAIEVDHLTLYRSKLTPGGAQYSVLAEFPLGEHASERYGRHESADAESRASG